MPDNNLADKAGIVVFSRILTTFVDTAVVVAMVRILDKEGVAVIGFLLLAYHTIRYLVSAGFPDSVFYFFERIPPESRRSFAYQTSFILLVGAIAGSFILFSMTKFVSFLLSEGWAVEQLNSVRNLLPLMAVVALFEIPVLAVNNLFLAANRVRDAALYQIITSSLTFLALVLPLGLGFDLAFALSFLAGSMVLRFTATIVWINRILPRSSSPLPKGLWREQVRFSLPLGLSSLVGRLNKYIDKYVVSAMLPALALADYSAGAWEIPVVSVIPFAVSSVLISDYVRYVIGDRKAELLELWYKSINKVSLVVIPLGILFMVLAHDLILLLFGADYAGAILPFQIYTAITLQRVTSYGGLLQSFGDTRGVLFLSVTLLMMNLIFSIPFTYQWGIAGTAAATLAANLVSWYLALKRIGRHIQLPFYRVLPFPAYLRILGLSSLCGIAAWLIRFSLLPDESTIIGAAVLAGAFLLLFMVSGTIAGIISGRDWIQLRSWLGLGFLRRRLNQS